MHKSSNRGMPRKSGKEQDRCLANCENGTFDHQKDRSDGLDSKSASPLPEVPQSPELYPSNRYVVAVKRKMRNRVPSDWMDQLQMIDGLSLVSEPRSYRVLVEANPEAVELAQAMLGDYCHIEPLIWHEPL